MTQEDKQLLLKDICARLPYGVKCKIHYTLNNETTFGEDVDAEKNDTLVKIDIHTQSAYFDWYCDWLSIEDIRPYLRPMSSMTEEEQKEFVKFHCVNICPIVLTDMLTLGNESKMFDWLNAHHFDYRGLIEKGLAIEAHKDMYNTKTE